MQHVLQIDCIISGPYHIINISHHHLRIQQYLLSSFQIRTWHRPASCHPIQFSPTIKSNIIKLTVKGPRFSLTKKLAGV